MADLRVNELLEFFSLELSDKIFLIHEVIDVDAGLGITTEKLSSLLDGLVQSQSRSDSFTRVAAVLGIELFTELLHDLVVHIATSKVSVGLVANDASLLLLETSNSDGGLGVTHVDKGDNSLIFFGQVILSEETIIVANGCALINDT